MKIGKVYESTVQPAGMNIFYGFAATDYGKVLIGKTERGICWLGFENSMPKMKRKFPRAVFKEANMNAALKGEAVLDLYGTPFQLSVWKALLKIPHGKTLSYKDIARQIKNPKAVRAVGTANGANPVSLLVPCHRVIAHDGTLGGYGWGLELKKKILQAEAA